MNAALELTQLTPHWKRSKVDIKTIMLLRFCQSLVTLLGASDVFFCFQFPRSRDSESRRRP